MYFSKKVKCALLISLVILNIILRIQIIPREIGVDTFWIHLMINSLNEFGYAKWILHPLSFFGLYPASYTSSLQFFISGISQSANVGMQSTIFIYSIFAGILSIFAGYIMAGKIIDDDLYKFLIAFGFSTSPAVVGYTTWTIATRSLFVILAPLLIYLLLQSRISIKYALLTVIYAIFLFATHHLFYFLIPGFFSFFILILFSKSKKANRFIKKIPSQLVPIITVICFLLFFLIPFYTGRFLDQTRYSPLHITYIRQMGILIILSIGGLGYLITSQKKNFGQWFLLLSLIFLTTFIYKTTYMKWFIPIFAIPLAGIGLINLVKLPYHRKYISILFSMFLVLSISFVANYQFIHDYKHKQYVDDFTYKTGIWMKENTNGSSVSNDIVFGRGVFSVSETAYMLTSATFVDLIYGFIIIDISDFKRYPLTDEDFWFSAYAGPDVGQMKWEKVNMLWESPSISNITYVVENTLARGDVIWNHKRKPSKILHLAYDEGNLVYDNGKGRIWELDQWEKYL